LLALFLSPILIFVAGILMHIIGSFDVFLDILNDFNELVSLISDFHDVILGHIIEIKEAAPTSG
jgi:hypothetical protein